MDIHCRRGMFVNPFLLLDSSLGSSEFYTDSGVSMCGGVLGTVLWGGPELRTKAHLCPLAAVSFWYCFPSCLPRSFDMTTCHTKCGHASCQQQFYALHLNRMKSSPARYSTGYKVQWPQRRYLNNGHCCILSLFNSFGNNAT